MKLGIPTSGKRIALGVLVVLMGALGVAGGSKTIKLMKVWVTSLLHRES